MSLDLALELLTKATNAQPQPGANATERVLAFENELSITVAETPDQHALILRGAIVEVPPDAEDRNRLITKCLRTNLVRLKFQCESVALDAAAKDIFLWRRVGSPASPADTEFCPAVEAFLNSLEFWRAHTAPRLDAGRPNMKFIFP